MLDWNCHVTTMACVSEPARCGLHVQLDLVVVDPLEVGGGVEVRLPSAQHCEAADGEAGRGHPLRAAIQRSTSRTVEPGLQRR